MNTIETLNPVDKPDPQLGSLGVLTAFLEEAFPLYQMLLHHIVNTSRAPSDRRHATEIKLELRTLKFNCPEETPYSRPFTVGEITAAYAYKQIKAGKTPN